jgi:HK97 family phage prohead protease
MKDDDTLVTPELEIVRTTLVQVDWRAAAEDQADDVLGVVDVRFSPFNTWYEIDSFWEGRFLERTVPGAFKRTINQHNDANSVHSIKTLFNHGMDLNIGDKLLGDITQIREDKDGPVSTINLWDTSYNRDLLPGLKRGSYGASFMFRVTKESWDREPEASDHNPEGLPERTVRETSTFEAGPVTWPASPTASSGMRCTSGTDAYYDQLARRDPERVQRMRDNITALRSAGRLAIGARPPAALAPSGTDDSAPRRSTGMTSASRRRRLTLIEMAETRHDLGGAA